MDEKKYTPEGLPVVSLEVVTELHNLIGNFGQNDESKLKEITDISTEIKKENPFLNDYIKQTSIFYSDRFSFISGCLIVYHLLKKEASKGLN